MSAQGRPPFPPFTRETAAIKARAAEDAWNSRDPERVSLAYTVDSAWRNRAEFFSGRPAIVQFLSRKWAKELDYRLIKEVWACEGESHRGALRLRVARRLRTLVPFVRQRELGIRRARAHAPASRQHQRRRHHVRPSASSAGRWDAGRTITRV